MSAYPRPRLRKKWSSKSIITKKFDFRLRNNCSNVQRSAFNRYAPKPSETVFSTLLHDICRFRAMWRARSLHSRPEHQISPDCRSRLVKSDHQNPTSSQNCDFDFQNNKFERVVYRIQHATQKLPEIVFLHAIEPFDVLLTAAVAPTEGVRS